MQDTDYVGDASSRYYPLLGSPYAVLTEALHTGDDSPVLIYAGEDIDGGTYSLLKQARRVGRARHRQRHLHRHEHRRRTTSPASSPAAISSPRACPTF